MSCSPSPRFNATLRRSTSLLVLLAASSTLSLAAFGPGTVVAQQVDQAGAEALKEDVDALFDFLFQGAPELERSFDGTLEALPDGDGYTVLVPQLILEADDDFLGTLPPFEARVTPQDNGWQEAVFQLNAPFVAEDPGGDESATLNFESDVNTMVIAPEFGSVLNGEIGFSNISVSVDGPGVVAQADRLEAVTQTTPIDGSAVLFDNIGGWLLQGLSVDAGPEGGVQLGALELSGETERLRLDLFKMLTDQFGDIDPDDQQAMAEAAASLLAETSGEKWLGGFDYTMAIEDLSVSSDEGSGSLGLYEISVVGAGLDQPLADLGLALAVEDIASPNIPPPLAPIVPTVARAQIGAVDAPLEALMQLIYDQIGTGSAEVGPKGRRMGTGVDFERLEDLDPAQVLGIIMQSDALVELDELFIDMPIGTIDAEGVVDPNPAAAFQVTADFDIAIVGLPEMIAFAQQMGGGAADAAALGAMLGAMGEDATDDEGRDVKLFDLEITAAGQILLNGNDMSAMMGMFQ